MSGGEIARAVLTENCKKSRPIFYTISASLSPSPALGQQAIGRLQTKADSWFLCMNISTFVARSTGGIPVKNCAQFQLTRVSDHYKFFQHRQIEGVNGASLGKQTGLEDYILLGPASDLEMTVVGLGPSFVVTTAFCLMTLSGIEYYG